MTLAEGVRLYFQGLYEKWKRQGYTQGDIAESLGCTRATITYLLSGKRKIDLIWLEKLATFFQVSPTEVVSEASRGAPAALDDEAPDIHAAKLKRLSRHGLDRPIRADIERRVNWLRERLEEFEDLAKESGATKLVVLDRKDLLFWTGVTPEDFEAQSKDVADGDWIVKRNGTLRIWAQGVAPEDAHSLQLFLRALQLSGVKNLRTSP